MRKAIVCIGGVLLIFALADGAFAQTAATNSPYAKFNAKKPHTDDPKKTGHVRGPVSNTQNWKALHDKAKAVPGHSNGATPNGAH